jgi:nitrogen fixation NifU-like protein
MQHASNPVGYRADIQPTHRHEAYNPQCGDRIEVCLRLAGGVIEQAAFNGEACQICMASASMLCESAPGTPAHRLRRRTESLEQALGRNSEQPLEPELAALEGVRPYPSRVQCATLPWLAAVRAMGENERGVDT